MVSIKNCTICQTKELHLEHAAYSEPELFQQLSLDAKLLIRKV